MGRGRAKAKQVKVARQLKYNGGGTDLDRLRAELGVGTDQQDADDRGRLRGPRRPLLRATMTTTDEEQDDDEDSGDRPARGADARPG